MKVAVRVTVGNAVTTVVSQYANPALWQLREDILPNLKKLPATTRKMMASSFAMIYCGHHYANLLNFAQA